MVFVRKKNIKGKDYYYLVSSTIKDGKTKKIERYVGLNPPSTDDLEQYAEEFNSTKAFIDSKKEELENIKKKYQLKIKNATKDELAKMEEEIVTKFTYDTNRIEGSTLTYKDTKMLLEEGISPKEKPMRDIKETENHKQAYFEIQKNRKDDINKKLILKLHAILKKDVTEDAGSFRTAQVRVHNLIPINAKLIDSEIDNLIQWYKDSSDMNPLELATMFHCMFEKIHPFFDGNGRVGRLLLNFILLKKGFPVVIIQNKNKRRYYNALKRADDGNYLYMIKYLFSEMKNQIYWG